MKSMLNLFLYLEFFISCTKISTPNGTPKCIERKIAKGSFEAVYKETGTSGKVYYLVDHGCCDQFSELYDDDCNFLCSPSGGITGNGDGKCTFTDTPHQSVLIWKK